MAPIERVIDFSIRNRAGVVLIALFIVAAGIVAAFRMPIDAIPDLSDAQVIVYADYPNQAPAVVEDQVTYPLTTALLNVPGARTVRGYSFFGGSFVYVLFEDGTDIYWARSRVLEYLNSIAGRLPKGVSAALGPDATGVGWIYEYALVDKSGKRDLSELRSLQDWFIRYELQSVDGVAEVASVGGFVKQYQVVLDPAKLRAYGVTINGINEAIKRSNNDVGARVVEMAGTEFMVRGLGYIKGIEDLKNVVVKSASKGVPLTLGDIAEVRLGPEQRRGVVDYNGEGETVAAIVVMRHGENARKVIAKVKEKLESIKASLPEGVEIREAYDRSGLIDRAVATLKTRLVEESIVVALLCALFLFHARSALVAVATIPVGMLASILVMSMLGINANIMSLGGIAIAIGAMIDAAIVMIENAHKHLEKNDDSDRWRVVAAASKEVAPALFFSLLIITFSFLPIFALEAEEGRLFKPLAYTKTFAMAASAIIAVTLVPVLMGYLIKGRITPEDKNPVNRRLIELYLPLVRAALQKKKLVLGAAAIAVLLTVIPLVRMDSEFMPVIDEGDLVYMPTLLPGVSIAQAKEIVHATDKIIMAFPEVESVLGKTGRAETATDPAPLSMIESVIKVKPRKEWRSHMTPEKLRRELSEALKLPGISKVDMTMPIQTRIDMLSTGIRSPAGVKIAGPDIKELERLSLEAERILSSMDETDAVFAERAAGGNYLDFEIDRKAAARYGLNVGDVEDAIEAAIGGVNVTETVEGRERYPVNVRYGREHRDSIDKLSAVLVPTPGGEHIPIGQLAVIKLRKGAAEIKSEDARLNAWIYVYPKAALGSYVAAASEKLKNELKLPAGYSLEWSGRYEYLKRARARLMLVMPFVIAVIAFLLYMNFRNLAEPLIVMLTLPFALVGGVWFMYILGYNMSVASAAGFIALAGVAAETGVVMLVYLDIAYRRRMEGGGVAAAENITEAVIEGAAKRVRPKIMTVAAIIGALLPIMIGGGTGSEVMKRIAAPMVGGMLTAAALTLIVIPVVYHAWKERGLSKGK
ncbi:MAG: CusA/CzcA family heavy metal efflux RND transporter [Deltaproteobacteria bacterium]|nr:CusA/CzcA family heavy metal efflux RND transporter [Deltaproteobacteria bacterium]